MARPIPGQNTNTWGTDLNAWLDDQFARVGGAYNWKPQNTKKLRASLGRAMSGGIAEWVGIGDSFMAGSTTSGGTYQVKSAWPFYMRDEIGRHGVTIGGTGFVRGLSGAYVDTRYTYGGTGWTTTFLSSAFSASNGAFATVTTDIAGDRSTVWYYDNADSATFTVSVNGASSGPGFTTVTTSGPAGWKKVTLSTAIAAGQTIKTTKTSAGGNLFFGGAGTWTSTGGLILHDVAQPGSMVSVGTNNASNWAINSSATAALWTTYAESQILVSQSSADVLLLGFGTNDLQQAGWTNQQVLDGLLAVRNHYAPNADVVLVLNQYVNPANVTAANWDAYATTLYGLADSWDCPLIDVRKRLGSYTDMVNNGLVTDGAGHLVAAGTADVGRGIGMLAAG